VMRTLNPLKLLISYADRTSIPSALGEPAIILWLLIRGAKDQPLEASAYPMVGKNEAACATDAAREVVEQWLPKG